MLSGSFFLRALTTRVSTGLFPVAHCSSTPSPSSPVEAAATVTSPLNGKVVLITGATAGIGKAIAKNLAKHSVKLVLIGRRVDHLESLKTSLTTQYPRLKVHLVPLSVTDFKNVAALPELLPKEFAEVDVVVNNAGLALGVTSVDTNNVEDAAQVINTNVMGTIAICSAFLPGMKARGRGHLVNMGSVAGHYAYATGSVYNASKYAIHGFTEAARHDLIGTPLRATHISPGLVGGTEFSVVRLGGDKNKAASVYDNIEALRAEDVAEAVEFALTRPAHVQVADVIMYATNQSAPRELARVGKSLGAPLPK